MPGDLSNPEFMFPFHYDSRYEPGTNLFEPKPMSPDRYIWNLAMEQGIRLGPESLDRLKIHLEEKGFLHRNPGDESFQNEVIRFVKSIKSARRIVQKCQI